VRAESAESWRTRLDAQHQFGRRLRLSDERDELSDTRLNGGFMERINVRVEPQLKEQLEAEAKERGVRPSDIVREALQEHIRQRTPKPSCLDLARRIGLVGIYKDTPSDLSTNPKHMEGFGRE
jgi:hypothetical protein